MARSIRVSRRPGLWKVPAACCILVFAHAAARADYPDYAPAPPAAADREQQPAAYADEQTPSGPADTREPVDRYPRAQIQLPNELRPHVQPRTQVPPMNAALPSAPPATTSPPAATENSVNPRPLPVRFQPVDYQTPITAQPAAETQPLSDAQAATEFPPAAQLSATSATPLAIEKGAEPQPAIPLVPQLPAARSGFRGSDLPPWAAGAGSLAIVLGLFLALAWVMRRGMPKNVTLLPREAVEVLGRAPLVGREHVYLVRCANKMLLVSHSAGKLETLTEITDAAEVDRLAGMCQQMNPHSVTASFRQVFQQFGNTPAVRGYPARRPVDEMEFSDMEDVGNYSMREMRS
jgi:flagellar biogenesis protein FliO